MSDVQGTSSASGKGKFSVRLPRLVEEEDDCSSPFAGRTGAPISDAIPSQAKIQGGDNSRDWRDGPPTSASPLKKSESAPSIFCAAPRRGEPSNPPSSKIQTSVYNHPSILPPPTTPFHKLPPDLLEIATSGINLPPGVAYVNVTSVQIPVRVSSDVRESAQQHEKSMKAMKTEIKTRIKIKNWRDEISRHENDRERNASESQQSSITSCYTQMPVDTQSTILTAMDVDGQSFESQFSTRTAMDEDQDGEPLWELAMEQRKEETEEFSQNTNNTFILEDIQDSDDLDNHEDDRLSDTGTVHANMEELKKTASDWTISTQTQPLAQNETRCLFPSSGCLRIVIIDGDCDICNVTVCSRSWDLGLFVSSDSSSAPIQRLAILEEPDTRPFRSFNVKDQLRIETWRELRYFNKTRFELSSVIPCQERVCPCSPNIHLCLNRGEFPARCIGF
ncbi:hypothetical protein BT69DRAFT_707743 [Atractiella rhizophila]|nr:hypothetical protein BT69DRAFT_707743 [Atractiella rhizophila]